MKRKFATFLALALFAASVFIPASAAVYYEDIQQIQPRYTYIDAVGAKISISSSGKATCTGVGYAKDTYATVDLTVQLQQYLDGGWKTLEIWTGSDVNMAVVSGEYYVYKGYKYRTKTNMDVYDEDGNYLESASGTQEKTY